MSLMNTITKLSKCGLNMKFNKSIKVVRAFVKLNDITKKIIVSISSAKGSLWYVFLLNSKLVVTRSKVDLQKDLGSLQLIK